MSNDLAEFGFGEGAIQVQGRFAICNIPEIPDKAHRAMIVGVLMDGAPILDHDWWDMWDAKIILIPKVKYKAELGWEAGDILERGLGQMDLWGEPYWKETP